MQPVIVLAGGAGHLGRALSEAFLALGHRVLTLTRRPRPGIVTDVAWHPDGSAGAWAAVLEGSLAVINLAGQGIADKRWTAARKAALRGSRLLPTRSLAEAIRACAVPPRAFLSSSAVGYYGAHGDEVVTEDTPPGGDFLARMCVEWEGEALRAEARETGDGSRVVLLRTGIVLDPAAGALKEMLLPFRLGLGARLGSGRQFMSWIHVDDWVSLVVWLVAHPHAEGPFNLTAPAPVTNAHFTRALGRALHRPAPFRAPAFVLRVVLGEFASFLVTGQRVVPARAEALGFAYRYRDVDSALSSFFP